MVGDLDVIWEEASDRKDYPTALSIQDQMLYISYAEQEARRGNFLEVASLLAQRVYALLDPKSIYVGTQPISITQELSQFALFATHEQARNMDELLIGKFQNKPIPLV